MAKMGEEHTSCASGARLCLSELDSLEHRSLPKCEPNKYGADGSARVRSKVAW